MKKLELITLIFGLIITLTISLMWITTWDFPEGVKVISMLIVVGTTMVVLGKSIIKFAEGEKQE